MAGGKNSFCAIDSANTALGDGAARRDARNAVSRNR